MYTLYVEMYPPDFAHFGVDVEEFKQAASDLYLSRFDPIQFYDAPILPTDASGLGGVLSVATEQENPDDYELAEVKHQLKLIFDRLKAPK